MNKDDIVLKVKSLGLPDGSYVVFGSCPMAAVGIRDSGDVDMMVTKEILNELAYKGWKQVIKGPNDTPLQYGVFDVHDNWNFSQYKPTLDELLADAMVIDGVPFASLEHVRKWKAASGRQKDLVDIKLIDDYIATH